MDGIRVRRGLRDDQPRIAELLELNGLSRWIAFEETFFVAERGGRVLAALRYGTGENQLLLGSLVADPWAGERPLAVALYVGAGRLAREMGFKEIFARPMQYGNWHGDYPYEAGYCRVMGGWRSDTTRPPQSRRKLPAVGWRRMLALWARWRSRFSGIPQLGDGRGVRTIETVNDRILHPVVREPKRRKRSNEP